MAYTAPRTRALRLRLRRALGGKRGVPSPQQNYQSSPPAFWFWFDEVLTRDQRDQMNYALNGPALREVYARLWVWTKERFAARMVQQ